MLRFLTAGESHGPALIGVIEGLPAGLTLTVEMLKQELLRRKIGYGRGDRQKIENESIEILSGVRFGKTIGSPVTLLIKNQDFENWQEIMSVEPRENQIEIQTEIQNSNLSDKRTVVVPRPGHADMAGGIKYGFDDMRNVLERSSARETAVRVALGAVSKELLKCLSIQISSRVVSIGDLVDQTVISCIEDFKKSEDSQLRVLDPSVEDKIKARIDKAAQDGDTLGGIIEVVAWNVPVGVGSYVQWDRKIDGDIGQAFLSLNAIKGVEIGMGFQSARVSGRSVHDEYFLREGKIESQTNRSGGITGGVTTGAPIVVRAAMKPLSTMKSPLQSVNVRTRTPALAHYERSDVCAVPSAAVIGESLLALVLANRLLEKFGGDSIEELSERVSSWRRKSES